jgi:hypothetical protein
MMRVNLITKVRSSYAALLLALLAGCGGGAPTTENANTTGATRQAAYTGPNAQTADIQAFKINFWDKMVAAGNPCGECHANTQTPRFMRSDDINLAYDAANTVVDLANPGMSRIVAKVGGGHHCWVADNSVCSTIITGWISDWASSSQSGGGRVIQLTAPTLADPSPTRTMPASAKAGNPSFEATVYPLLRDNCAGCHATVQQPFFASPDVDVAYAQARAKMNLDLPENSRLVLRLRNESHNCWRIPAGGAANCVGSANAMQAQIEAFAGGITVGVIPPEWKTSKALGVYGGVVASGGTRYDNNVIALYEFKTGSKDIVYDTSGISPAADLTLSGLTQWVRGWGVQFNGGKAQASTITSAKLHTLIGSTGEYSIEAWAAPANVTQADARIVTYSGSQTTRNFRLGQTLYNYDFFARTSTSTTGGTQLSTPDAQRSLQASLQHVVVTYSPLNGRRIYVNGVFTGTQAAGGTSIGNSWDDTFVLALGNEVSNDKPWLGTLKMVAIHNRALTTEQVAQNFAAGVGEKYLLLFSVSHLVNVPQSYIMFEVSEYDNYSYMFSAPKFISLDANARPGSIAVKGMRIGVNGQEPIVGQAYKPLNMTITDSIYSPTAGASLSNVGTVIASEHGAAEDEFFLTFEQLGSSMDVRTEPASFEPPDPMLVARPAQLGVNTFDGLNETYAQITGVSLVGTGPIATEMRATYQELKQSLPAVPNFQGFLGSHQIAAAQLAIAFCSTMVDDPTLRTNFFGNVDINSTLDTTTKQDAIIDPVITKVLGSGLLNQPDVTATRNELRALIDNTSSTRAQGLCRTAPCGGARTLTVMKAVCGAALASGATMIQ